MARPATLRFYVHALRSLVRRRWSPLPAAIALLWVMLLTGVAWSQQFPYVAYVEQREAYVHSGPSQRHYPTDRLQVGFAVEVFRHDPDGWCAIRPPVESFSWIPVHQIRLLDQHSARVIADQAVVRVGSRLSTSRSAVQVMLKAGERVELLDGPPDPSSREVRVAAPAGEFRWIAAKHLSRRPPLETDPPAIASLSVETTRWQAQTPLGRKPRQHVQGHSVQGNSTVQQSADEFGHLLTQKAGQPQFGQPQIDQAGDEQLIDVIAGSPAELQFAQYEGQLSEPQNTSEIPRIRFRDSAVTSATAPGRLAELQLRLSQAIGGEPQQWNFAQLQSEATALLEQSPSSDERAQLRDLLDRIARFERIGRQYAELSLDKPSNLRDELREESRDDFSQPDNERSILTSDRNEIRRRARADLSDGDEGLAEARYDAVGMLKPVVSRQESAPPFALVDDRGDVIAFLTPTPDLKMQSYLGRRIGVQGTRGFMPEYRRAHVTASRVTPITETLRR